MEEFMKEFDAWLNDLSAEPVPGGVAAAAVAGAMGAALVTKSIRATLKRPTRTEADIKSLQTVLVLAGEQQTTLLQLADADEKAYAAVLELEGPRPRSAAEWQVWRAAIEIPIQVSETCQLLLAPLPYLRTICMPVLQPDLQTGAWLLEAGMRAGLVAAESNLSMLGDGDPVRTLRARMDALRKDQQ
jgi:formiminotetrahydrofolate cyclodeaminase